MAGIGFTPQILFDMEGQQGDSLCWIAVAVSVQHYFETTSALKQCELVRALLNATRTCCDDDALSGGFVPIRCDKPGKLVVALGTPPGVDHLNDVFEGTMTFADVQRQIDRNLPVCAYISWGAGEGHFILISGYNDLNGVQYLYVKDPLYRDGVHTYETVANHYLLDGQWTFTYRLRR